MDDLPVCYSRPPPVRVAVIQTGHTGWRPVYSSTARYVMVWGMPEPIEETKVIAESSVSGQIIAAGIVIAFCYWASTVLVTVLVAVLTTYFLDPVVSAMERVRIPRALGSLVVVLLTLGLLAFVGWSLLDRVDQFGQDWP